MRLDRRLRPAGPILEPFGQGKWICIDFDRRCPIMAIARGPLYAFRRWERAKMLAEQLGIIGRLGDGSLQRELARDAV
jgi:hypothetical protein